MVSSVMFPFKHGEKSPRSHIFYFNSYIGETSKRSVLSSDESHSYPVVTQQTHSIPCLASTTLGFKFAFFEVEGLIGFHSNQEGLDRICS